MPELRRLRGCVASELRAPLCLEFTEGTFAPPVGVGSLARAYFDGTTLFLCAVSTDAAVSVEGMALGTAWVPTNCPAVVWVGNERFDYAVVNDEPARAPAARPADQWGTHTVVMSMPQTLSPRALVAHAEPSVVPAVPIIAVRPKPSFDSVTVVGPPPSRQAITALALPSTAADDLPSDAGSSDDAVESEAVLPVSFMSKVGARVRDDFRRTPRNIRVTLFALPLVAWAALGFGSSAESAALPGSRPAAPSVAPPIKPGEPVVAASAGPDLASSTPRAEPEKAASKVMRGKRTLEASAADAAAHGAYAESAQLYRELAAISPERPEFAAAARILQAKAAAAH